MTETWRIRETSGAFDGHMKGPDGACPPPALILWFCDACKAFHLTDDGSDPNIVLDRAVSYRRAYVDFDEMVVTYELVEAPRHLTQVRIGLAPRHASSGTAGGPEHTETTTGPGPDLRPLSRAVSVPPEEDRGTSHPNGRGRWHALGRRWSSSLLRTLREAVNVLDDILRLGAAPKRSGR